MNQTESQKLYIALHAIVKSSYTQQHISYLFNLSARIATQVLYRKIQIYNHYFPVVTRDGSSIMDEAKSMISILFNRNERNVFIELQNFFLPKLEEIDKNVEKSIPYLKQLIQSKIRQELVNRFKQEDIEGYRLYRNIQLAPNRNSNIGVFNISYKKHYYFDDKLSSLNDIYNKHEKAPKSELLEEWYKESFVKYKTTPGIVLNILKKCQHQSGVQNYISITALLSLMKQGYKPHILINGHTNSFVHPASSLNHSEISMISSKLKFAIESKLVSTYEKKKKANLIEKEMYTHIVMNYFDDLIHRGECLQLKKYIDDDSHKTYLETNWPFHRSRIEYLIKHGKNVLKEIIIPI